MEKLSELYERRVSRRKFMAGASAVGAASMLAGCSGNGTVASTSSASGTTDADVLNFALNLEYLEAEFYLRAATGSGLTSDLTGSSAGTVTGGAKVPTTSTFQQNIINEIAYDEQQHVRLLRSALGAAAVSRPAIDLSASFNTLATAAGIGSSFNPFADFNSFLVGAFIFEDVGVTAYTGASTLFSSMALTNGVLLAAAGLQAVEAYHAAYVRTALTANATAAAAAGTSYPYLGYANKVSALRATLGGGNETQLVVPAAATSSTTTFSASAVVAADSNALAYARSTDQVLHIVYGTGGGAGVKSGVFFPSGMNGNVTVTAS